MTNPKHTDTSRPVKPATAGPVPEKEKGGSNATPSSKPNDSASEARLATKDVAMDSHTVNHTDTSRSSDLKPCPVPWCEKKNPPRIWHPDYAPVYTVDCPDCGLETNDFATEAEAVAAWNSRPTDRIEALEAEVERLREALKTTHNLAVAYAAGTGTLFDEAMAEARAALGEKQ